MSRLMSGTDVERAAARAVTELGARRLEAIAAHIAGNWPRDAILEADPGAAPLIEALAAVEATTAVAYLRGVAAGYAQRAAESSVQTVWSGPATHRVPVRATAQVVIGLVAEARHELLLMTYSAKPYPPLTAALTEARGRGVTITAVVETLQGAGSGLAGAEPYSAFAAVPGVELWHWPAGGRAERTSRRARRGAPSQRHPRPPVLAATAGAGPGRAAAAVRPRRAGRGGRRRARRGRAEDAAVAAPRARPEVGALVACRRRARRRGRRPGGPHAQPRPPRGRRGAGPLADGRPRARPPLRHRGGHGARRHRAGHLGKPAATMQILDRGYRVPRQIIEYASRLLPHIAPDLAPPTSVRRSPGALCVRQVAAAELYGGALTACDEAYGEPGSIGLIAADAHVPELAALLAAAGREFVRLGGGGGDTSGGDMSAARLVLTPASQVKGLEFDHVIVVEPAAIVAAEARGLSRLYVALTRAVSRLFVVHAQPLPAQLR
jgi:hypothetical protein